MANSTPNNRISEPNLTDMAKYTIALQHSFEEINDVLSQRSAGFVNDKTALNMIEEIVEKVLI